MIIWLVLLGSLIVGLWFDLSAGRSARAAEPQPAASPVGAGAAKPAASPAADANADAQANRLMIQVRRQRDEQSQARQDAQAALSIVAGELAQARGDLERATKREAELDAYLKACGDHPGCTVPITK